MTQIKICGLTDKKEAEYLAPGGVNYAGMVLFYEKSKRNISIEKAREIIGSLPESIKKVAVVVSPNLEQTKVIQEAGFDILQIHGKLQDDVYEWVTIDIWKAFNIKDIDDYDLLKDKEKIRGFVFDSAEPGSGKIYDLDILSRIERNENKFFILAGGLNPENVADAIKKVQPDIVDVSSGVEDKDKLGKNPNKIKEFVNSVQKV